MLWEYIEAPTRIEPWYPNFTLFLAGGITGCPDWQKEALSLLSEAEDRPFFHGLVFNPRRSNFDVTDSTAAEKQIRWEYQALYVADAILFWFPEEQIQPIALFELGRWSFSKKKPVFLGAHPNYPRRKDLEVQMDLLDKPIKVHSSLKAVCDEIFNHYSKIFGDLDEVSQL